MLVLAASLSLAPLAPAEAHQGLVHDGCPAGQAFSAGELEISGAYSRAMLPQAQVGGGYFTIANKGATPDRLVAVASEAAANVQLHQMSMDGDMMKMGEVEGGLEVPAGGTVSLAPGGLHVMFIGVKAPFKEGECLQLTLTFEKAGEVPVVLNIGGVSADAAPEGHEGHEGH